MWIIMGISLTLIYDLIWCLFAMSAQCSRIEERNHEPPRQD